MRVRSILCLLILSFVFNFFGCMSPSGNTVTVTELFTAIWCAKCYLNHNIINEIYQEYGSGKFVAIEYYVDSTSDHPFPRLSCKESEERMKWCMSDKGLPTTFFNGVDYVKGVPNLEDDSMEGKKAAIKKAYIEKMKKYNAIFPVLQISASCSKKDSEENYSISVSLKALDELSYSSLMLNIALIESNIPYEAFTGEMHDHVFREWIKPVEIKDSIGIPLALSYTGEQYKTEFPFHVNTELYKNDLSIILFVQDMETKSILQGLELEFSK